MIVFDLQCRTGGHRFEGWFASSGEFARQQERGLVTCPQCGVSDVGKAVMAPNVGRKGNQLPSAPAPARPAPARDEQAPVVAQAMVKKPLPPEAVQMMQKIAALQAEALKTSNWVGERFAEDARAMHYGERDPEPIHGQATLQEAKELIEEGIEVAPLLFPVAAPGEAN